MEISVGNFGRMMFEVMLGGGKHIPEHWDSIRSEVEPLVRQLLMLNSKMAGGGYQIYGYVGDDGEMVLSEFEKSKMEFYKNCVEADSLDIGDEFLLDADQESPFVVIDITSDWVYYGSGGGISRIGLKTSVSEV